MPFKDLEKKKAYHRQYMHKRRRDSQAALNPTHETPKFDASQPYQTDWMKIGEQWYPVSVQAGRIYHRYTHQLLRLE
jgi:hypothetical protein